MKKMTRMIDKREFRILCNLFVMATDNPHYDCGDRVILEHLLNRFARKFGFSNWKEAHPKMLF